jgi:hypothetical protein
MDWIVVHRPLPAALFLLRHSYLIVVPRPLPEPLQVVRNSVLCLPRLTVLVSIEADRPVAWFPSPSGLYHAWFPSIALVGNLKWLYFRETP